MEQPSSRFWRMPNRLSLIIELQAKAEVKWSRRHRRFALPIATQRFLGSSAVLKWASPEAHGIGPQGSWHHGNYNGCSPLGLPTPLTRCIWKSYSERWRFNVVGVLFGQRVQTNSVRRGGSEI
jgi:hypothetical protein